MRVGYVRVSTLKQNTARQKEGIKFGESPDASAQLEGVSIQRTFEDHASGTTRDRPKLREMMEFVREGDVVVVHSLDRLARNLMDLKNIVETLNKKGVEVEFVKERLKFTGKGSPMENLLLNVMGAFAEFERAIIMERQAEGIAIAKQKGKYKGRVRKLTPAQVEDMCRRMRDGESRKKLADEFGITTKTLYRYWSVWWDRLTKQIAEKQKEEREAKEKGGQANGA